MNAAVDQSFRERSQDRDEQQQFGQMQLLTIQTLRQTLQALASFARSQGEIQHQVYQTMANGLQSSCNTLEQTEQQIQRRERAV